jgi:hypothetical protein
MERVRAIVARLLKQGLIEIDDRAEFGHSFIGLLQGELFMRALLGTIPSPQPRGDRSARQARRDAPDARLCASGRHRA